MKIIFLKCEINPKIVRKKQETNTSFHTKYGFDFYKRHKLEQFKWPSISYIYMPKIYVYGHWVHKGFSTKNALSTRYLVLKIHLLTNTNVIYLQ